MANKEVLSLAQKQSGPKEVTLLSDTHVTTAYLKTIVNPRMQAYFTSIPEEHFIHADGTPFVLAATYYRPESWQKERMFVVIRKAIPSR